MTFYIHHSIYRCHFSIHLYEPSSIPQGHPASSLSVRVLFLLLLLDELFNVSVQPVPLESLSPHPLRSLDKPFTFLARPAGTLERLVHLPFRARVEERQLIALLQRTVVHDADFHLAHVEIERRVAGVVAVDEVRIELDVGIARHLDGCVRFGGRSGSGDFGEQRARWQRDLADCRRAERLRAALDVEEARVCGLGVGFGVRFPGNGGGGGWCRVLHGNRHSGWAIWWLYDRWNELGLIGAWIEPGLSLGEEEKRIETTKKRRGAYGGAGVVYMMTLSRGSPTTVDLPVSRLSMV